MENKKNLTKSITVIAVVLSIFAIAMAGTASAKSLYFIADHHTAQFDAWGVNPDGTATPQVPYNLQHAEDPAGVAVDVDLDAGGNVVGGTLFATTEFSFSTPGDVSVEFVDAMTMAPIGYLDAGIEDLAGIAVDDANNIVYAVERWTDNLYAFDWDPSTTTLTSKAGYPVDLPGCVGAIGIALNETTGILWVADAVAPGKAIAYNVGTWTEDTSKSFTPSHQPVDIAVDRDRGIVYTISMTAGAWTPSGTGSNFLSKWDGSTETTFDLGNQGVGVAVDEVTGYVYVTVSGYIGYTYYPGKLQVWDTSTATRKQLTTLSGSPAGICIPQEEVSVNPLNLTKDDGLGGACVNAGGTITYDICYDNTANPTTTMTNVEIVDDLPPETTYVSGGSYNAGTHQATWNIGTLQPGASQQCVQLVVNVDATATGTITNYATIDSDQTEPTPIYEQTEVCPPSGGGNCCACPPGSALGDPCVCMQAADQNDCENNFDGTWVGPDGCVPGTTTGCEGLYCQNGECIPEFSTIALPVASILGLLFYFNYRKRRREQ